MYSYACYCVCIVWFKDVCVAQHGAHLYHNFSSDRVVFPRVFPIIFRPILNHSSRSIQFNFGVQRIHTSNFCVRGDSKQILNNTYLIYKATNKTIYIIVYIYRHILTRADKKKKKKANCDCERNYVYVQARVCVCVFVLVFPPRPGIRFFFVNHTRKFILFYSTVSAGRAV